MTYTTEELLAPAPWLGQRVDEFRFELLDRTLTKTAELHPARDASPQIRASVDATIMRQLSGIEFVQDELANIDVRSDRIRVVCVLQNGDEFPMGVFMFGDHNTMRTTTRDTWAPVMYDQALILDDPLERTVSVNAGDNLQELFHQIAFEVGVPAVHLDTAHIMASEPVAWPAGRSRFEVEKDISFKLACFTPYFDAEGMLTCRPVPDPAAAIADFSYPRNRIVADTIIETDDSYQAPNRYIAIGTSSTVPIVGVYDLPPAAPHSVANRGYVVTETVDAPGLESAEAAYNAARAAAVTDTRSWQRVAFTTPLDPRLDLFALVDYDDALYLEVGFTIDLLSGGEHRHELARLWR